MSDVVTTKHQQYVDLKKELQETKDLLLTVISSVPVQKEYVHLAERFTHVKQMFEKQAEIESLLRQMNVEWQAATNRMVHSLEVAKQEKLEFKGIYTAVLEKEMRLIAAIKEDIAINEERFLRGLVEMAGHLTSIRAPSWSDRAKQYGLQLLITVGILAMIVGVYHLAGLVVRLF